MSLVLVGLLENELYLSHWALIVWKSALWIVIKSSFVFLTRVHIMDTFSNT